MSTTELRELDAWIAEHVMGLGLCQRIPAILTPNEFVLSIPNKIVRAKIGYGSIINFQPTTDPAAAMMVLNRILDTHESPEFYKLVSEESFSIKAKGDGCCTLEQGQEIHVQAETLPITICLFANKLFTKPH